jgi:hypothetical protein
LLLAASLVVSGCATVEMEPQNSSSKSKEFNAPSQGTAGLYIYPKSGSYPVVGKPDVGFGGPMMGAMRSLM